MTTDATTATTAQPRVCAWPDCHNPVPVADENGNPLFGRPPSYCGQVINGVRHNRGNYHRGKWTTIRASLETTPTTEVDVARPYATAVATHHQATTTLATLLDRLAITQDAFLRAVTDALTPLAPLVETLDDDAIAREMHALARKADTAIADAEDRIHAIEAERDEALRLRDAATRTTDEALADLAETEEDLKQAQNDTATAHADAHTAHERADRATRERDHTAAQLEAAQATIKTLTSEKDQALAALAATETRATQAEELNRKLTYDIDRLTTRHDTLENQLHDTRDELRDTSLELVATQSRATRFEKDLDKLEAANTKLAEALDQSRRETATAAADRNQALLDAATATARATELIARLEAQDSRHAETIATLQSTISALKPTAHTPHLAQTDHSTVPEAGKGKAPRRPRNPSP